ncbi:Site-specific recombinase XerD [Desulfocicer vacuolatum DSM 3385]|uniref:Site-specific recombinase XerD n=1 Tax=Desulfocicer vacuolatum DSM 3385 TaxID=1121400 RepID=A0A1W2BP65_9BACT|nr:site-specific integrase [Desulfocicer vacuolatum]SMC74745.1 Site-specific recombinase XerD [Desulfocicer vacuolatum DSM 3385]
MAWKNLSTGVRCKEHPTRKNGIKPDLYFSVRYQFDGKIIESGLGWSTDPERWTQQKAIAERQTLIDDAKTGRGAKTYRQRILEKKEAVEDAEKQKHAVEDAHRLENVTIEEYFRETYYPRIQRQKKAKTHQREEALFRIWINPAFGEKPFKDVSKADVEDLFYFIVDAGKTIRTAEYAVTTLKQIWRDAKEDGCAPPMPTVARTMKKRISKNDNARVRYLSHDEAEQLLDALKQKSITLYEQTLISIHCGLRSGEILGLTWDQVDQAHGVFNLKNTKSGKGRAVIMTSKVKEIINSKKQDRPNDLIYPGRGGVVSTSTSSTFKRVANELFNDGVTDPRQRVVFHTCRHTCASWMVMQGVSLYLVQKVLGHSTIQVTERYSHLAPDQLQLAANAIDRAVTEHREKNVIPFKKKA